jgi:hypothetical protein
LIDFKNIDLFKQRIQFTDIKQQSPYEIIAKEAIEKLMLLLELNPSADSIDAFADESENSLAVGRLQSLKELANLKVSDIGSEMLLDPELLGLDLARSKSVQMQPDIEQSVKEIKEKVLDKDDWMNNYIKYKEMQQTDASLTEKDLKSSFWSPLHAVVSFVTNSFVIGTNEIRKEFQEQIKIADYRALGIYYLCLVNTNNMLRFHSGSLASSLGSNPFNGIETCRDRSIWNLLEDASQLSINLKNIPSFDSSPGKNIGNYLNAWTKKLLKLFNKEYSYFKELLRGSDNIDTKKAANLKLKEKKTIFTVDENLVNDKIRIILSILNEINVLLNDNQIWKFILKEQCSK